MCIYSTILILLYFLFISNVIVSRETVADLTLYYSCCLPASQCKINLQCLIRLHVCKVFVTHSPMSCNKEKGCLTYIQTLMVLVMLHKGIVQPELLLFPHILFGLRKRCSQRARHLGPVIGKACAFQCSKFRYMLSTLVVWSNNEYFILWFMVYWKYIHLSFTHLTFPDHKEFDIAIWN